MELWNQKPVQCNRITEAILLYSTIRNRCLSELRIELLVVHHGEHSVCIVKAIRLVSDNDSAW